MLIVNPCKNDGYRVTTRTWLLLGHHHHHHYHHHHQSSSSFIIIVIITITVIFLSLRPPVTEVALTPSWNKRWVFAGHHKWSSKGFCQLQGQVTCRAPGLLAALEGTHSIILNAWTMFTHTYELAIIRLAGTQFAWQSLILGKLSHVSKVFFAATACHDGAARAAASLEAACHRGSKVRRADRSLGSKILTAVQGLSGPKAFTKLECICASCPECQGTCFTG